MRQPDVRRFRHALVDDRIRAYPASRAEATVMKAPRAGADILAKYQAQAPALHG